MQWIGPGINTGVPIGITYDRNTGSPWPPPYTFTVSNTNGIMNGDPLPGISYSNYSIDYTPATYTCASALNLNKGTSVK
jgi:hypothetical protein